jgi:hypothetical protein
MPSPLSISPLGPPRASPHGDDGAGLPSNVFRRIFATSAVHPDEPRHTHSQVIAAPLVGGWRVYAGRLEIGGVVAFISGIERLTDRWGDPVNYFRDLTSTQVKYHLFVDALDGFAGRKPRNRAVPG